MGAEDGDAVDLAGKHIRGRGGAAHIGGTGDRKAAARLAELYRTGKGVKRDRKRAAEWQERSIADPKVRQQRQHANAVGHWMLRVCADAALAGCFLAGVTGLSYPRSREDLIGAVYLGTVALIFHALALYMRPKEQKRAPRAVHIVLGAVLVILLLAILSVFWGGGVVDPEDIWIIGWIAAIAALALYRAFRKR